MMFTRAAWFCAAQLADCQSLASIRTSDPVLFYLIEATIYDACNFFGISHHRYRILLDNANIAPPKSISPSAAIEFVKRAGITGNVFNSYDFGGYLIFAGIPTFIDGGFYHIRIALCADTLMSSIFKISTMPLNIGRVRGQLGHFIPGRATRWSAYPHTLWAKVYSDNYAVVLVRR